MTPIYTNFDVVIDFTVMSYVSFYTKLEMMINNFKFDRSGNSAFEFNTLSLKTY